MEKYYISILQYLVKEKLKKMEKYYISILQYLVKEKLKKINSKE